MRISDWSSDVCSSDLRGDAMLGVIRLLLLAAAVGFAHRAFHAAGDAVGVEDDAAVDVPRGAAARLDEAGLAAPEPLLVGVEDRSETSYGKSERGERRARGCQYQ